MDLLKASFSEISSAVKQKKVSAKEVTQYFIDRAQKLDTKFNSFISMNDQAVAEAQSIDQRIAKGEEIGPLAGVPFGIKDMLCTKGLKTTAGSKILHNFIAPYDATVVARLKKAGVIVIGKTNQDEFAMGSSSETSYFGAVKNPWNLDYVPGGSSGGSAAAQAARLCAGTIGTDTGGSIRQPASFCGIVGVKPTYGRVSRYGIVAYASSLDQAGPMVSSVADAALTLEVISGHDQHDSTTTQRTVPQYSKGLNANIKGLKVGIVKEYLNGGLSAETEKTFQAAIENLKKLGAEIIEVSLPSVAYAIPVYYLVATSEASSNLARYDGVRFGYRSDFAELSAIELDKFYMKNRGESFGPEVQRRIMIGTYALSSGYFDAYYLKACQVRRVIANQYITAFKSCNVILSPVTAAPAFKIGERISDPLAMYLNDIFTTATNLAGLPGMSVPYGMSQDGMPIGMQLTGGYFDEMTMLNVAASLENTTDVTGRMPNV